MSAKTVFVTSENLIKDLAFKQRLGLKADLIDEALAVVDYAIEMYNNPDNHSKGVTEKGEQLSIGPFGVVPDTKSNCCTDDSEIQFNLKLFLDSDDPEKAIEAVRHVINELELPQVDSLILAVPLNNLPYISIGMVKPDMNEEDDKIDHILEDIVPEKEASITGMANLWNTLTKEFVQDHKIVLSMGLCDLDTNVFKRVYHQAEVKPTSVQVNLKSCCTVPPNLQSFAKENGIKLHTHSDPMGVLGPDFVTKLPSLKIGQSEETFSLNPNWMVKMQSFIKSRGVLADKRYIVSFETKK